MAQDNFDDYFEFEEHRVRRERFHLRKRYIRDAENPLDFYSDIEFRKRYRFSKDVVVNIILPLIIEPLQSINNRGLPISPVMKLLISLRFYATGNFQTVSGDLRKFSQSSVSIIIKTISILLAEKMEQFVKFPVHENEQRNNILKFHSIAEFPLVAACIDCTHISITSPGGDNAEVFRNRKGYFSINVQVVAGLNLEIMDIVVRHPGSSHDSVIFDRSSIRVRFERQEIIGLLLGDNGYACCPYLLTPIVNPTNRREENYNKAHKSTRNLVERVFGIWKRRFPCLHRTLTPSLNTSIAIICATAVLHNIALEYNPDENELNEDVPEPEIIAPNNNQNEIGLTFRRRFINTYF